VAITTSVARPFNGIKKESIQPKDGENSGSRSRREKPARKGQVAVRGLYLGRKGEKFYEPRLRNKTTDHRQQNFKKTERTTKH